MFIVLLCIQLVQTVVQNLTNSVQFHFVIILLHRGHTQWKKQKLKRSIEGEHSKNLTEQKQKHTLYRCACVCVVCVLTECVFKIPFHCIDFDSQHSKYVHPYTINSLQHSSSKQNLYNEMRKQNILNHTKTWLVNDVSYIQKNTRKTKK